ncbi:hypothetical protein PIB30_114114, partial [Stylosanthes scabra]|nr:hypothetical protein [Stylosanthes scabra]
AWYFDAFYGFYRKIEERKLADQETEFGSKIEQSSTHMRGRARIFVLLIPNPRLSKLTTLRRGNSLDQSYAYA